MTTTLLEKTLSDVEELHDALVDFTTSFQAMLAEWQESLKEIR